MKLVSIKSAFPFKVLMPLTLMDTFLFFWLSLGTFRIALVYMICVALSTSSKRNSLSEEFLGSF
jgi:hypothetical protein